MVGVAQLVEHLVVAQVAGSSSLLSHPIDHPGGPSGPPFFIDADPGNKERRIAARTCNPPLQPGPALKAGLIAYPCRGYKSPPATRARAERCKAGRFRPHKSADKPCGGLGFDFCSSPRRAQRAACLYVPPSVRRVLPTSSPARNTNLVPPQSLRRSTRLSPTRRVSFSLSRCSMTGMAYLRDRPVISLNSGAPISPFSRRYPATLSLSAFMAAAS